MTLKEIKASSVEEVAEWFVAIGACPLESEEESGCIVDEDGDISCKDCWLMHLNGINREPDDGDWAKKYGRGYMV